MEDLREYLKNPEKKYSDGLALYQKYNGNDKHLKFLKSNPSADQESPEWSLMIQKLQNRLRILSVNIAEQLPAVNMVPGKPIEIRKLNPVKVQASLELKLKEELLPDNIRDAYVKNKSLIIEIAGHHGAMKSAKDDAGRQFQLEMLTRLQEEKDANWKIIDEYLKGNKEAVMDGTEDDPTQKRIITLKKNIRRAKQEIKEKKNILGPEKVAARKEKIAAWDVELKDLTKKK